MDTGRNFEEILTFRDDLVKGGAEADREQRAGGIDTGRVREETGYPPATGASCRPNLRCSTPSKHKIDCAIGGGRT